jgi:subtilase family serine protease
MQKRIFGVSAILLAFLIMLVSSSNAQAIDADLVPVNFTFSPDYPVQGEAFDIYFEVINTGIEPASNVDIIVWNSTSECDADDECLPIFESTESTIAQDKNAIIDFSCGVNMCGGTGDRVLTIAIDYNGDIEETNESNNRIVYEFTIYEEPLANLRGLPAEINLMITPESPAEQDSVDIMLFFENNGRQECTNYYIDYRQTFDGVTTSIEEVEIRSILSPGESAQYNITWNPSEIGDYIITVVLDSRDEIDEFREDDNLLTTAITIRAHNPELTLDISRNITITPDNDWLESIFNQHSVGLEVHIFNLDYVKNATNIRVGFYDLPEGGNEAFIGYAFIASITNSTRIGEEIIPGTNPASITWDSSTGTDVLGNHTIIVRIDPLDEIEEWNEWDNNFTFEVKVLESKPDLTIFDIFVVGQAVRGIPSDVILTVYNKGSMDVSDSKIDFRIDGDIIESWDVSLLEGEFYNVTATYVWDQQQPSISGHADPSKSISELDESNNVNSILINVAAPEYDLTLVTVDSAEIIFKGDYVTMIVQVRNNLAVIPNFRLAVYLDNSSSPEIQTYDFEGNEIYYISQEKLGYEETRFIAVYWKSTNLIGNHNITIEAEITNSDFEDQNLTDNKLNTSIFVKPKNYQLSIEMINMPSQIYLNQTLEISVSALNFGPEICCECPVGIGFENSSECIGAEISLFINEELFKIYQTSPLGRVNGEEVHKFTWTPTEPGNYYIEARIDPDNIIDEYNELDNTAYGEVNVTVEEFIVITPEIIEDDSSLISEPLVWVPLVLLSVVGLGVLGYSRLGDGGDYLDYYESDDIESNIPTRQSGFRYDPVTGNTYDSQTGEIIEQGGKKE